MLKINEEQIKVFEQLQFLKLKQQIDKVLSDEIEGWEKFDFRRQRRLIEFLFNEAQKAKMIFDSEYILFALVCMSFNGGCQSFLGRDDVQNFLLDEELDNDEKLTKLSELTKIKINKEENLWRINRRKDNV